MSILRKSIPAMVALTCVLGTMIALSGCGRDKAETENTEILCSFLPVWILTTNIVGDTEGVDVEMLLSNEVDPHSFAMSNREMKLLAKADILVLNGYGLELFLGDTVEQANPEVKQIIASERVDPILFSHEHEEEEEEEDGEHHHEGHDHGNINPHTWVSPAEAVIMVETIRDGLMEYDKEHAEKYDQNAAKYIEELKKLTKEYEEASAKFTRRQIVTAHHAFEYLARDMNLEIVAVLREIEHQEPSPGELKGIIDKIKESGAKAVFVDPMTSPRLAEVVAEETGLEVLVLDPLGTGKMDPGEYIRVMRKNLEVLKNALM